MLEEESTGGGLQNKNKKGKQKEEARWKEERDENDK